MMAGITISYLVVITLEKTKTSNVGLVDYLVLDEKPLLLLGGMLKPSVRYRGVEEKYLGRLITCRWWERYLPPQPIEPLRWEWVDSVATYLRQCFAGSVNSDDSVIRIIIRALFLCASWA